jgi:hypothetical protein
MERDVLALEKMLRHAPINYATATLIVDFVMAWKAGQFQLAAEDASNLPMKLIEAILNTGE